MPIKVRVGQTEAVKILSSKGGGSVATQNAVNVIGGIASVSQLSVTGISTVENLNIIGIATGTFDGNLTGNITGTASGLSGTPDLSINNIVGSAATFSGDVIITGKLTYEDVTNIDSVGLVTARSGLRVNTGGLIITSGISTFSGIATFTNDVFVDGTLTAGIIDGGVF